MYKDLITKLNKYIVKHEESVGQSIYEYQTTYDLLCYNLNQVKKVIDNFDKINYIDKIELLDVIEEEFHIKHTKEEYDAIFHSRKNDDELAKKESLNVLEGTLNELRKRVENVKIRIEYLKLQTYEFSPLLAYFDEETYELIKPFDSKEKYDLLIKFLNAFPIPERNVYLNMINKNNLALLILRDKKYEESILEVKKKEALLNLEKVEVKKTVIVQIDSSKDKLSKKEQDILEKALMIIEENKSILENISKEAAAGFEIISESDEHIYDLADCKTNLEIVLLDINNLVKKNNEEYKEETFKLLEQAFKGYELYKEEVRKLEEEIKTINEFEEEHAEELEIINRLVKKFNKTISNMTKNEKNFLISIENEYKNEEIPEKERETNIMNICSGSRISLTFYKKIKKLAELNDDLILYNSYDLDTKKVLFEEMMGIVDEINELDDVTLDNPGENDIEEKQNNVLYLTLPDGKFGVQDFIYSDAREHYLGKISQIERVLSKFETYDQDDIHNKTKTVKGQSAYKDKIRRIASGQVRVPYIPLNSLWTTNIPLDKPCYVIISAGFKRGEKALYEYVNTQKMVNYVQDFIKRIQNRIDVIRLSAPQDEVEKMIKEEFNNILSQNHTEFTDVLDLMKKDFVLNDEEELEEEGELSL